MYLSLFKGKGTGLKKKRKSWYIETWYYGGEWLEDEITETKLNVVKETADLDEIIRYLVNHNEKEIEHIYKDARKIYNEYLDLSEYFHKNLRILLKTCIFAGFLCGSTPTKLDINTHPSTLHLECFLCEKHTRYLFFRIQLNIKINNQSLINHAKDEVLDTLHLC